MRVILLKDIKGTGKINDIVEVADGYARNRLIPAKIAVPANEENLKNLMAIQEEEMARRKAEEATAIENKHIIEDIKEIKFNVKSGKDGRLFGSITTNDIATKINEVAHTKINKKDINLNNVIRTLGVYNAEIRLYEGVYASIAVLVE